MTNSGKRQICVLKLQVTKGVQCSSKARQRADYKKHGRRFVRGPEQCLGYEEVRYRKCMLISKILLNALGLITTL